MREKLLVLTLAMSLAASANMAVAYAYSSDTIKVGNDPKDVTVDPKTNMVYVANFDDVVVIDGSTNNIVAKIPIGKDANGFAIDVNPNTNRAYVAASLIDSVIVIDTSQNKIITTIPVGNDPEGIAVNQETNMIYVANTHNSDSPDSISVIDGVSNKVIGSIDVRSISNNGLGADFPSAMAIDAERNLLYIGGTASTAILIVNGSNNEIIDHVERNGNFRRMVLDSATDRVYAANIDYGTIDVIGISDDGGVDKHVLMDPISKNNDEPITYPQAIDINQKTSRIYVSDGDSSILVIDGESRQILSRIDVGRIPLGIAVDPETNMIYVANFDSDSISVIDGITGKVILTPASFIFEIIAGVLIAGVIGSIFIVMNRKRLRRKFEST